MEKFLKYQKYNPRHFSCPMKQQKSSLKKCILIYLLSLLVFLVSCGRTQEFFACNKLGIFCYFSVLIQWDFFHSAPISSDFQLQRVCFDDALT